jgi:phosphoribosylformylglycinamidine synthase
LIFGLIFGAIAISTGSKINDRIVFQYCDKDGNVVDKFPINPNGSMMNIAGITNEKGNVLALMPHPERASFNRQQKSKVKDGEGFAPPIKIFENLKEFLQNEN